MLQTPFDLVLDGRCNDERPFSRFELGQDVVKVFGKAGVLVEASSVEHVFVPLHLVSVTLHRWELSTVIRMSALMLYTLQSILLFSRQGLLAHIRVGSSFCLCFLFSVPSIPCWSKLELVKDTGT